MVVELIIGLAIGAAAAVVPKLFEKPPPPPPSPPLPPPPALSPIWPLLVGVAVTASVLTWLFGPNRPPPRRHDPACPICDESIVKVTLPCEHSFHIDCIRNWFLHGMDCPTCGNNIPEHMENVYRQQLNLR